MRHRKRVNKLNRFAEHRKALLANLAASLIEKKRIKTTHTKAKAAQQFVERLITIAKKDTLHARRMVLSRVRHKSVMQMLFNDIAPNYSDRPGGYTRVIRMGKRPGDGAELSVLELVGFEESMKKRAKEKKEKEAKKESKKPKKRTVETVEPATVPTTSEVEQPAPEEAKNIEAEKQVETKDEAEETSDAKSETASDESQATREKEK